MLKRPAMLMLELLLTIGVVMSLLGFYFTKVYIPEAKRLKTEEQFNNKKIVKETIKNYIRLAAKYNQTVYLEENKSFAPIEPLEGDQTEDYTMKLKKTILDKYTYLKQDLATASCFNKGDDGNDFYLYKCATGEEDTKFVLKYKEAIRYNDIYTDQIPIFEYIFVKDDRILSKDVFSFLDIYLEFKKESMEKLNILKKRIEDFAQTTYIKELGSPCSTEGGLDSWDDFNIPWVWKVLSEQKPENVLCQRGTPQNPDEVKEIVCSCESFNEPEERIWSDEENGLKMDSLTNEALYERMLTNVFLPKSFKYDAVGNPINIILFSKLNTEIPEEVTDTVPNEPREDYVPSDNTDLTINSFKQGEVYTTSNLERGVTNNHFETSRKQMFYK